MTVVSLVDFGVYNYPEDQLVTIGKYNTNSNTNFININYHKTFSLLMSPMTGRNCILKTVNGKKTAGSSLPKTTSVGSSNYVKLQLSTSVIRNNYTAEADYNANMNVGDSVVFGFRINVLFPKYVSGVLPTFVLEINSDGDGGSTASRYHTTSEIEWAADKKLPYIEVYFEKTGASSYNKKIYVDKVLIKERSATSFINGIVGFKATNKQTPKQEPYCGVSDIYVAYNNASDTSKTGLIGPISVKHVYPESVTTIGNWKTDTGATELSSIKQTISKSYKHEDSITRKDYVTTDEFGGKLSVKFKTPLEADSIIAAHYMVAASRPESTSANMNVSVKSGTDVILDKKVFPIEKIPKVSFLKVHGIENQSGNATITPQQIDNVEVTVSSEPIVVSPF